MKSSEIRFLFLYLASVINSEWSGCFVHPSSISHLLAFPKCGCNLDYFSVKNFFTIRSVLLWGKSWLQKTRPLFIQLRNYSCYKERVGCSCFTLCVIDSMNYPALQFHLLMRYNHPFFWIKANMGGYSLETRPISLIANFSLKGFLLYPARLNMFFVKTFMLKCCNYSV